MHWQKKIFHSLYAGEGVFVFLWRFRWNTPCAKAVLFFLISNAQVMAKRKEHAAQKKSTAHQANTRGAQIQSAVWISRPNDLGLPKGSVELWVQLGSIWVNMGDRWWGKSHRRSSSVSGFPIVDQCLCKEPKKKMRCCKWSSSACQTAGADAVMQCCDVVVNTCRFSTHSWVGGSGWFHHRKTSVDARYKTKIVKGYEGVLSHFVMMQCTWPFPVLNWARCHTIMEEKILPQ